MRSSLFYLALLLVGCGGSGGADITGPVTQLPPVQIPHFPAITDLALSPNSVMHMDGDGNVVVSAEIMFADTGLDIQSLWVRMPDGTRIEIDKSFATETGTFTEDFTMSTERIGGYTLEFWLVDAAGDSSIHHFEEFNVAWDAQSSDWTSRLSGLPFALNDVIWDGTVFIAVGDGGTVLTSADGIDWIARESDTDNNLHAVAVDGSEIFAVGAEIVLLSTNHGESWVAKAGPASTALPDYTVLQAVVVNSSQVIAFGAVSVMIVPIPQNIISEDRGDTWQTLDPSVGPVADVINRDGLFVATTYSAFYGGVALVLVSSDGKSWNPITLKILHNNERGGLHAVVHDGSQFVVAGQGGSVYASFDGFNWEEKHTPVKDVDYLSGAWNGSRLVFTGGYSSWIWSYGGTATPPSEVPVGVSSTDGGVTWDIFNIDGEYQGRGMAFGNGLFVSVGQSESEGAIYTSD